jgi:hypothetical protein
MTLDLHKITPQIVNMVGKLNSGNREHQQHIKNALEKLCDKNVNIEKLKHKIEDSRTLTQWPVAGLVDELLSVFPAPPVPDEYTVLAADGSHIDIDRNQAAHCYLINIGAVKLSYGANSSAELESFPQLYSDESDLVICSRDNEFKKENIQGALLDAKRSTEECRVLAEMVSRSPDGTTTLALMDGSLILFGLENYPKFVADELLINGFLKHLDRIMAVKDRCNIVLGSYISSPRSAHVVNALKVQLCPYEKADCERYCSNSKGACEVISGVQDKDLFLKLLSSGERSALFINPSVIVDKYYGQHRVEFFYLRLDDEISRVEVPDWVARDQRLLELTHALVRDQCRRGQGYPVVLSEAHEQAVLTGMDRKEFWDLVEQSLSEEKLSTETSFKSRSKRTRWI